MTNRNALSNFVPPDPDLSSLPVDFHVGGTPLFGLVLMIAGIIGPIVVGGILGLLGLIATGLPESWVWIVLGFAAIPLLAIPWGWWVMHTTTVVRIGAESVGYRRTTPLGSSAWQAPLAEYTAVVYRLLLPPSTAKGESSKHGVELRHGPGRRDVRLVAATEEALARGTQVRLAALTGLPAVEEDPTRG